MDQSSTVELRQDGNGIWQPVETLEKEDSSIPSIFDALIKIDTLPAV